MAYKMIQVGTGGRGEYWCRVELQPLIQSREIEVVAAVDISVDALKNAQDYLGLAKNQCYVDLQKAFDENPADFCTIVVPPVFHEDVVDIALSHGMHILSEKPIADTIEGSIRVVDKVKKSGVKMGVTMTHRFDQDKTTMRREINSGLFGELDYMIFRMTCNRRKFGQWGEFRYQISDPLMIEGAIHHLDILADFAGAKCDTIYAHTWNPDWTDFKGDCQALVTMKFENGVKAFYEGAKANLFSLNEWENEYIRAEFDKATLVLDHRELKCYSTVREGSKSELINSRNSGVKKIQNINQAEWGNSWLIRKFIHWLDGGKPMETNVEDNLQSMAMVFSAIESSRTGLPVKVQDFLSLSQSKISKIGF